ncbi:MAG: hypothetical protein MH472_01350 [Bacteroidia bacterium]|nr:hypothetical protein [Bacteroidia bacterium]
MQKYIVHNDPYLKKNKLARIGSGIFFADYYFPCNFELKCQRCNSNNEFYNNIHFSKRDENGKLMGIYKYEYQCQKCFKTHATSYSNDFKSPNVCQDCGSEDVFRNHPLLCKECGSKL